MTQGNTNGADERVSVVIATRNRLGNLRRTLHELGQSSDGGSVRTILVDNGSSDGTPEAVRGEFPSVRVVPLEDNLGAAARTIGVRQAQTPYVAFADDDSWWPADSLSRAAGVLDASPALGLVAAKVLLGDECRPDPVCAEMSASPLPRDPALPGVPVLGFIACGAVARREAYLATGGFHPRFGVGGEEELLAMDMMSLGWQLSYVGEVVAHHYPSPVRDVESRHRVITRNALWCAWLRRPLMKAVRATVETSLRARGTSSARAGVFEALRGLPWVLRERRRLPRHVEAARSMLEAD